MSLRPSPSILLLPSVFLFLGCSIDVNIDTFGLWKAPLTKILSKSSVYADGQTKSVMKLQVFDTNGSILPGLALKSSEMPQGVVFDGCTLSDGNGISYCFFRSTSPGTSSITISDGYSKLDTDLTFIKPAEKLDVKKIAYSKVLRQTEMGYTVVSGLKGTNTLFSNNSSYSIETEGLTYKLNFSSP